MRPFGAVIAALLLAACVTAGPAATPVGSVKVLTESYPVEALANGTWRARVNGAVVPCAKPDATACYWSVRHHLLAQELLDDLG
ncbi:MAG: hypothetical protein H6897_09110 [Rhodobacteraceae bacterium]|jgi:hypothetical protein|uniref:hypothetical protein n=1 Tax=Albidovulum sp. TaxID=1872424 RepID=UPI001E033D6A|nr:hypothetical protein [uncultured Defluviimonas sp.]MCB2126988.1 hypothetical protein [Paracoccaceae bacterium]MCC0070072.1 hypothetical protein [Paracoccaceae bacterium]